MGRRLVYIDTETTGLDVDRHELLEVAWMVVEPYATTDTVKPERRLLQHTLRGADPRALAVNQYYERSLGGDGRLTERPDNADLRHELLRAFDGATLVGANPAFDARFLERFLGSAPWHHRLFDIEAYASGVLGWHEEVKGLSAIAKHLDPEGDLLYSQDHSAVGDMWLVYLIHMKLQERAS